MTHFSSRSNLVPCDFEWEKVKPCIFPKLVVCGMKVGCTWTSVNAKDQGHSMNKLANQQISHVFSNDISSEATWQLGSQFVCTIHELGF